MATIRCSPVLRRAFTACGLILVTAFLTGCQSVGYYARAIRGQVQILARQQSCDELLSAPDTPVELKARLALVRRLRVFAETELGLPVAGQYSRYADLDRRYVVWNIYAAPRLSLELKTWRYPFVGRLGYRGYFSERAARRYASGLEARGLDVYVEGVEAYSTLGWFKDPILSTFIHYDDAILAEILFHELAHQRVFVAGDTRFNEAFATAVGQEGARRWLRARGDAAAEEEYRIALERNAGFVRLVGQTRDALRLLYNQAQSANDPEEMMREKRRIVDALRRDYELLKAEWGGFAGYDGWFDDDINNAKLSSVATYNDLVPAFQRLLANCHGNLDGFYTAAERLTRLPHAGRQERLQAVASRDAD